VTRLGDRPSKIAQKCTKKRMFGFFNLSTTWLLPESQMIYRYTNLALGLERHLHLLAGLVKVHSECGRSAQFQD
jgi:hypothetical protein